jgi:hypothetical protein
VFQGSASSYSRLPSRDRRVLFTYDILLCIVDRDGQESSER